MSSNLFFVKLLWVHPKLARLGRLLYYSTKHHNDRDLNIRDDVMKKIIYNSRSYQQFRWNRILAMRVSGKEKQKRTNDTPRSISLKFLSESTTLATESRTEPKETIVETPVDPVMPIGLKVMPDDYFKNIENSVDDIGVTVNDHDSDHDSMNEGSTVTLRKVWNNDYVGITHAITPEEEQVDQEWVLKYGTSNPNIPSSNVPCGGCGALIHCKDSSIPGFIPQELFSDLEREDLRGLTCQRCYFLQNHNTALAMAVNPKVYPRIISSIKTKSCLALLAVDLTDFPCSIWPGVLDLVGLKCPVFLVGNKVDILCGGVKGWMSEVEKSLRSCFPRKANILGTQLISAKTGFGVEELISKLHEVWGYQGDVYLVGCTNVGKSTLFNALLQSDYCKVKASDLVQRATTAPWPGTTLNLLKFPIMRPEGWRTYLRSQRLKIDSTKLLEAKFRRDQQKGSLSKPSRVPQLIGHIGRTFRPLIADEDDPFQAPDFSDPKKDQIPGSGLDPNDPHFKKGRWFYDTPGVLHTDQILDLLTSEELMKVVQQKTIEPRTFIMKPGWTLFVGGLARVDFIKGEGKIKCTVFVSKALPITICFTHDADEVYATCLGTDTFSVPMGGTERLKKWPALKHKEVYKFCGISKGESCGDIILSSCGWISFTPGTKEIISVRPWTPEGRGIYTRSPSLLPLAVNLKGTLMKGTPAFSYAN